MATKVLLIEDNPDILEMYTIKFKNEGFDVITAMDGDEGIVKAIQENPDIILLDILMPNTNGFEVLEALHKRTKTNAKIIILSNLGEKEHMAKAYALGASYYMIKANYTPQEVVDKVRELLAQNKKREFLVDLCMGYDHKVLMDAVPSEVKAKICTSCGGTIVLKLEPNEKTQPYRTFKARFVCSKCGREI